MTCARGVRAGGRQPLLLFRLIGSARLDWRNNHLDGRGPPVQALETIRRYDVENYYYSPDCRSTTVARSSTLVVIKWNEVAQEKTLHKTADLIGGNLFD